MAPTRQRWSDLLLLPPPPTSIESLRQDHLRNAYQPALLAVLRKLASDVRQAGEGVALDIAVSVPFLALNSDKPRRELYSQVQALVAGIYKLICVVAAKENINVEDRDGIDVRILLIAGGEQVASSTLSSRGLQSPIGPVISLATLARSQRPWRRIFAVEGEESQVIFEAFSAAYAGNAVVHHVPRGSAAKMWTNTSEQGAAADGNGNMQHYAVILGGTFDHIHIGHKLLLAMFAFLLPAHRDSNGEELSLTIGITGDELLKDKKYADLLESWDERQESVMQFLRGIMDFRPPADAQIKAEQLLEPGPNGHANHFWLAKNVVIKCVEISDGYGPTITIENLTALVISAETRAGGKAVNDKRKEKGWAELEVFEVDVLDAQDTDGGGKQVDDDNFQAKLSSTTIRKGLSEKAAARSKV